MERELRQMVTVIATIRLNQTTEVRAEGKDYDEAKAAAEALVPDGHSILHFRRETA